jgi:hypothetical protein
VALALAACPTRAAADFNYRIAPVLDALNPDPSQADPASHAEFTVYLDVPQGTTLTLTDFQVTLILEGVTTDATKNVGFVKATTNPVGTIVFDPAHPNDSSAKYIFEGNSLGATVSTGVNFLFPDLAGTEPYASSPDPLPYVPDQVDPLSPLPPTMIVLSDLYNLLADTPQPITVTGGTTVRLGTVTIGNFNAPTTNPVQIRFVQNESKLDFLDPANLDPNAPTVNYLDGASVTYDESKGLLTVNGALEANPVPAPPGALLLAAGWGCLALTRLARRRPTAARAESV